MLQLQLQAGVVKSGLAALLQYSAYFPI